MQDVQYNLYEPNRPGNGCREWLISFEDRDRLEDQFFRVRNGTVHLLNDPLLVRQCFTLEGKDQIRTEIEIGEWLSLRLPESRYPQNLSRLLAFNQDDPLPWVTVFTWRGVAMADLLRPDFLLRGPVLIAASQQIFSAVDHLATARVVHGNLGPATVRWDDSQAQLVDFRHACRAGGRRGSFREHDPWASPEQWTGTGEAHPGDDVYCAALLVFRLATGEDPGSPAEMRKRLAARSGWLQRVLKDVFADHADQRPSAATLLARLSYQRTPAVFHSTKSAQEQAARETFRALRGRQREYVEQLKKDHQEWLAAERQRVLEEEEQERLRQLEVENSATARRAGETARPVSSAQPSAGGVLTAWWRFPRLPGVRPAPIVWVLAAAIVTIVVIATVALVNGSST